MIEPVQIVTILPTRIWIESDMVGARHVVLQHEGHEAFTYASFHYDYAYTSNSGTHAAAESLAAALGATQPIEHRTRESDLLPSDHEMREQIEFLQRMLRTSPSTQDCHAPD